MNIDIFEVKADEAWKSLIAESPYLLMSSRELEKCKNFFKYCNISFYINHVKSKT